MLVNIAAPISSSFFLYHNKTFISEFSNLPWHFSIRRIYDDACDKGFTMVSERTGKTVVFVLDKIVKNESDIYSYNFKCITRGFDNLAAVIFND